MPNKSITDIYLQTHSYRVGIAYASMNNQSLTVVVLPKAWKKKQNRHGAIDINAQKWEHDDQFICVYENQYVHIDLVGSEDEISETTLHDRNETLEKLLSAVENDSKRKKQTKETNENEEEDNNSSLLSDIGVRTFQQQKNKITNDPNFFAPEEDESNVAYPNKEQSIASILKLLSIVKYDEFQNPKGAQEEPKPNNMLKPLLHYRFMKEMLDNYHNIRRSYVPRTAYLGAIKGQIDPFSAARVDESGETLVRCHYDEFEEGTKLMKVLVSALDLVTSGNWLTQYRQQENVNQQELNLANTQNKAIQLRHFLHSIPSLPRRMARQQASQIRTNRMTAVFTKALEYAKLILEDRSLLYIQDNYQEELAWCWEVDMSDVWEEILFTSLQQLEKENALNVQYYDKQKGTTIYPIAHITGAFGASSDSFPDILATTLTAKANWILDAKYSYFRKLKGLPNGNYRDQMFRYLYLMSQEQGNNHNKQWKYCRDSKPWADQLALIYTTSPNHSDEKLLTNHKQSQGVWPWSEDKNTTSSPNLYQLALPFPNNSTDIDSIDGWKKYIERMARLFERFLIRGENQ